MNHGSSEPWVEFIEASSQEEFCSAWLAIVCQQAGAIAGQVRAGLLLLGEPDQGPYRPVAVWPGASTDVQYLGAAAEKVITERQGLFIEASISPSDVHLSPPHVRGYHVAFPFIISNRLHGAVVIDVETADSALLQEVLRSLYWAGSWIENLFLKLDEKEMLEVNRRLSTVLELLGICLEEKGFKEAAFALVTELATRFKCERVSYGIYHGQTIKVAALSHTADFAGRMNLINLVIAAMEEATDQMATVVVPPIDEKSDLVVKAAEELSAYSSGNSVCTLPVIENGEVTGAITMERPGDQPFTPEEVEICEALSAFAGPVLQAKRSEDRILIRKIWDAGVEQLKKLFGPSHFLFKLSAALILSICIFFAFAEGDYRIKADARLEGAVQRAVVAPFDGYVFESSLKAGDIVKKGELLARLDDRDLRIEHLKWKSRREELLKEYRKALADHDRPKARIIQAQINQAEAQINLTREQLERSEIKSPFAGIIISGDLTQSLGAPVERGQVLFQVAPLADYRIVLEVDERDIDEVKKGQDGELLLSALPDEKYPFDVELVTPVATAEEGHNYFRVEAMLKENSARLRPGMEGVGKINIDRRRLVWIWTHEIVEWCRMKLWEYLP